MTTTKRKSNACSDDNALTLYLKEINRIPLLTREEEDRYAREAASGNKEACNKLAKANLRFVVNMAKRYQGKGLPLEDLINEGNIGLLNAIERYDADRGYHFISYAVWWIRQAIIKAICEKSRMIRLPMNRINELIQIEKARSYVQEGDSEITEIARFLDMKPSHVEELLNISRDIVSLENSLNTERDNAVLMDCIKATGYKSPEKEVMDTALHNDIKNVLDGLEEREADIIRFRYGLGDKPSLSLKEIGARMNLTKERIRQIEKKAIKQIQHSASSQVLESYVA